ncbi:hypothetical protein ACSDR0_35535, partial [Streptosporangium sp. G11]|uniref:hypothetical protein n=1 Tax=Streptosporangium sp. G11 TaxID=3436926 RepID=UPI003EB84406
MIIIATEPPPAGPFVCNTNNFILVGITNDVKRSKDRTPGAVRARFTHVVTKRPGGGQSGSPGGFHPWAPTDPGVNLSIHRAL